MPSGKQLQDLIRVCPDTGSVIDLQTKKFCRNSASCLRLLWSAMKQNKHLHLGVCVLAGGRSSRMGQDKARLRLGKRTLLGQVRVTSRALHLPVRIIRHDLVSGRGPLGGILTALKGSRAEAELFLACDMPFVSPALLAQLISQFAADQRPLFVAGVEGPGFPFLLPRTSLEVVEQQLKKRRLSLQALAKSLGARLLRPTAQQRNELLNINTPEDFQKARKQWKSLGQRNRRNQEFG